MDDLVDALAFGVGVSDNDTLTSTGPHPRFNEYKNRRYIADSQQKRRFERLDSQRKRRQNVFDAGRDLPVENYQASNNPTMEWSERPVVGYHTKHYRNQLMLSEWLVDIPTDFDENWIMVPCPMGRRCLVVANRVFLVDFVYWRSQGGPLGPSAASISEQCLLDCIHDEKLDVFYILDVLIWGRGGHSYMEFETDFRFFWLQSKAAENPELKVLSKKNEPLGYANILRRCTGRNRLFNHIWQCSVFHALPNCACSIEAMTKMMASEFPFKSSHLDGLLFYHRQVLYLQETTPLVGWLKPFMMPEICDVPVPDCFKNDDDQTTAAAFREKFDSDKKAKDEEREAKKKYNSENMDTENMKAVEGDGDKSEPVNE